MSKRNFILLILILIIAVVAVFGFLFLRQPTNTTTGSSTGTDFFSQLNPFRASPTTTTPVVAPPVNVSGYVPPATTTTGVKKLIKVSSMPIAGFTLFSKERLVPVAPVVVTPAPSTTDTVQTPPPVPATASSTTPATTTPAVTTKKAVPIKVVTPATEFAVALRYVAKATGNIYETFVDTIAEQQFSNTVFPQVYDAYFGNKGQSVVMRHLKPDNQTIETFIGALPTEPFGTILDGTNQVKGSFLPNNVENISLSLDNSKIFYLFYNSLEDDMIGTTLSFSNNKKVQIFDSPFTEWSSQWPTSNMIALSTKPSGTAPGYMYSMDGTGKNLTNVLSNINGLTTLVSPNGKLILYSDNGLNLNIYNISAKTSALLGIKTLSEKCVWGNASDVIYCAVPKIIEPGIYPDAWYQGAISFSDQIWKIDVATDNTTLLIDPSTTVGGTDIDGIKLALDPNGDYIFFVNKKDSFLWEFNLN